MKQISLKATFHTLDCSSISFKRLYSIPTYNWKTKVSSKCKIKISRICNHLNASWKLSLPSTSTLDNTYFPVRTNVKKTKQITVSNGQHLIFIHFYCRTSRFRFSDTNNNFYIRTTHAQLTKTLQIQIRISDMWGLVSFLLLIIKILYRQKDRGAIYVPNNQNKIILKQDMTS